MSKRHYLSILQERYCPTVECPVEEFLKQQGFQQIKVDKTDLQDQELVYTLNLDEENVADKFIKAWKAAQAICVFCSNQK